LLQCYAFLSVFIIFFINFIIKIEIFKGLGHIWTIDSLISVILESFNLSTVLIKIEIIEDLLI